MLHQQLVATIFLLALISLGGSTIGLYARPRELYRGFWLMVGLWGIIDGMIVWPSLLQAPLPSDELHTILKINLFLQLVYLPTGILLATRTQPLLRGFGWGVLVSALPLAVIDTTFYVLSMG